MSHHRIITMLTAVAIALASTAIADPGTQTKGSAKSKKASKTLAASKVQSTKAAPVSPASESESSVVLVKPSQTRQSRPMQVPYDRKSPLLAFGLSFVLPGAGQYYNGDYTKGMIQTTLFVTGITLALTLGSGGETYNSGAYTDYSYYGSYTYYHPTYTENGPSAWLYIGIGISAGSWLWSIIDAPISASAYNESMDNLNYGHMLQMKSGSKVVGFDLGWQNEGVAVNVVVHL